MKKMIFLDRDGVINKDPGGWTKHGYITKIKDFIFLPGALKALRLANESGYGVIVFSNQAGVGKGYYTKEKLKKITDMMCLEIKKKDGFINKVYYCMHKKESHCNCRKPSTGMFKKAEKEFGIKLRNEFFVGDNKSDIRAGKKMGMTTILLLSGKSSASDPEKWKTKPNYIFHNLLSAVKFIIDYQKNKRG